MEVKIYQNDLKNAARTSFDGERDYGNEYGATCSLTSL